MKAWTPPLRLCTKTEAYTAFLPLHLYRCWSRTVNFFFTSVNGLPTDLIFHFKNICSLWLLFFMNLCSQCTLIYLLCVFLSSLLLHVNTTMSNVHYIEDICWQSENKSICIKKKNPCAQCVSVCVHGVCVHTWMSVWLRTCTCVMTSLRQGMP